MLVSAKYYLNDLSLLCGSLYSYILGEIKQAFFSLGHFPHSKHFEVT
jgi:hypothetical protein